MLSIDIKLQKLIEDMFGERRGALVALDPKSGEVLAFVSKPTFDPNLFVEWHRQENWQMLNESSTSRCSTGRCAAPTHRAPPTNRSWPGRAADGQTRSPPPSSTTRLLHLWRTPFSAAPTTGLGPVDMHRAIVESSNVYFYSLANEMGVDAMHDFMKPLGFGQITGIDIMGEVRGVLPSQDWKRNYYKRPEQKKWYAGETISLGIGQGYNSFTMLQLAQATATLANNGIKHKPHLVIATQDAGHAHARARACRAPPEDLGYKPRTWPIVRKAMVGVTQVGTSARVFAGAGYLSRWQDRHGAGRDHRPEGQVQRSQAGRAPARPCAVHCLCTGR
jgi:penicillin-binding protein 2